MRQWLTLPAAILVLCVVVLLFSIGPYRPVEPLPPDIVDMHCHIAGIGAGNSGCFISPELRKSWRFRIYLRSFAVSRECVGERRG